MPLPADEEMPTPEGPLAPSSTYPRHAAHQYDHNDQTAAVQHIYDGETQFLAGETPELFPPQPTESDSLFGDRSSAGPMCLDDEVEFVSETSAGLTRGLPSAQRSIGSDLTNLEQVCPAFLTPFDPHRTSRSVCKLHRCVDCEVNKKEIHPTSCRTPTGTGSGGGGARLRKHTAYQPAHTLP